LKRESSGTMFNVIETLLSRREQSKD